MNAAAAALHDTTMAKTDPVQVRLEPEVKAALVKAAADDDRPVSHLIALSVKNLLRERGYLKLEKRK